MAAVTFPHKQLSGEVRMLCLREVKKILQDEKCEVYGKEFRNQLLLKLAGTILPRITEIGGEDGEPLKIQVVNYGDKDTSQVQSSAVPDKYPEEPEAI